MIPIISCKNCDGWFEPDRHTIQDYNIIKLDDVIDGDFDLKCPFCGARHFMVFEAQITNFKYWKD